jgi:hypothetical protein
MAKLTISDAARVTGVSRMLLYRYIKSGKLSRTPDGLIDTADLLRAGLMLQTGDTASETKDDCERILTEVWQLRREERTPGRRPPQRCCGPGSGTK